MGLLARLACWQSHILLCSQVTGISNPNNHFVHLKWCLAFLVQVAESPNPLFFFTKEIFTKVYPTTF